jgi:hypothetical protein
MGEERAAIERPRKSDHMALGSGEQELRPVLVVAGERERRSRHRRLLADRQRRHARGDRIGQFEPRPIGALRLRPAAVEAGAGRDLNDQPMPAVRPALIAEENMQRHRLQQRAGAMVVEAMRRGQHHRRTDQRAGATAADVGLHLGDGIPGRGVRIDGEARIGCAQWQRDNQGKNRGGEKRAQTTPVQCAVLARRPAMKRSMQKNQ